MIFMKKSFIHLLLLSLLSSVFPLSASAQGLHKDIDVEQAVTPEKRDAARIAVLPTVRLSPVTAPKLSYSSKVVSTSVPASFSVLDPVAWGDKTCSDPYRGYVGLGIGMPLYVGELSAGYRILDSERSRLNVWAQYNGDVYRRISTVWHDHAATAGASLRQSIGSRAHLDADIDYTYAFHDMPALDLEDDARYSQSVSRLNASVRYGSSLRGATYSAGISFGHFGFGNPHFSLPVEAGTAAVNPTVETVGQNLLTVDLKGFLETGNASGFGLDFDASFLHTGRYRSALIPFFEGDLIPRSPRTTSLFTFNPYYSTVTDNVTLRIGADVDIASRAGGKAVRIAPDLLFGWYGLHFISFEAKAHGGTLLNSLSSLYDITPYLNGTLAYDTSHAPLILDGKILLGPLFGAYLEVFGGYGRSDDWLMPVESYVHPGGATWQSTRMSGCHYGVRLGFDNGKNLAMSVSCEGAPGKSDKAWLEWRDRATKVLNASLSVRPFKPLSIDVAYELRSHRSVYGYELPENPTGPNIYYDTHRISLGTVSNLTVGASYELTKALTAFARGENLLNRRALYIGGRPLTPATALIGASFKF